jgi:phage portal protein BeeE
VGFFARLRGTNDEQRWLPQPDNELPLFGAYTASTVTPAQALAIADVWAAVRVLADAASSLPIHVYRKTSDRREQVTSGRLVELLDQPGPCTSQADLISSLMAHLAVYGAAYIGKYREQGEIVQLALLHPERVRPEREAGQVRFRYNPGGGPQRMLTADVVYVRGLSVDGLNGLSAVQQAARVLGLSDELVKHALSYFDTPGKGRHRPARRCPAARGGRVVRRPGTNHREDQGRIPAARHPRRPRRQRVLRDREQARRQPVC